ncbi:MAG: SMC-Scp complex subunit ScpB [Planctomyces sp.]|nr:SMC-Scp complex subunit ScpB [Planctomyces sp.]
MSNARETPSDDRPFSVRVHAPEPDSPDPVDPPDDGGITAEDLEAEWQRAVEASDQAELLSELTFEALGAAPVESSDDPPPQSPEDSADPAATPTPRKPREARGPRAASDPESDFSGVDIAQVLEAVLFVGGGAFTSRALADLVGTSAERIDERLGALNARYRHEARPYEIQLVDGSYRLSVTAAYEGVRNRVYGHAPKEVRLGPEALEILAFVAYQQPVAREQLEETGKTDADSLVRQLIRRDLVAIERGPEGEVRYRTTPRFLELFGLRSLNDLPRAEDVRFK